MLLRLRKGDSTAYNGGKGSRFGLQQHKPSNGARFGLQQHTPSKARTSQVSLHPEAHYLLESRAIFHRRDPRSSQRRMHQLG